MKLFGRETLTAAAKKKPAEPTESEKRQKYLADLKETAPSSASHLRILFQQCGAEITEEERRNTAYRFLFNATYIGFEEKLDHLATRVKKEFDEVGALIAPYVKDELVLTSAIQQNLVIYRTFAGPAVKAVHTRQACLERIFVIFTFCSPVNQACLEMVLSFLRVAGNLSADELYWYARRLASLRSYHLPGLTSEELGYWRDQILAQTINPFSPEKTKKLFELAQEIQSLLAS